MKKMWPVWIVSVLMIAFMWVAASSAMAWQNPCDLQDHDFIMSGDYVLMNFTDDNTGFSPRPNCAGEVTILCPDDRECLLLYGVWGDTLIIGENMYDMNFKLIDDNRLVSQNDTEWEDVLARHGCAASESPVCDSDHLYLCENQTACDVVGGYWCDEICQVEECGPVCPFVGNIYRFDAPEISYSLSNFRCEVGPGCRGTCDFRYGDFDIGPIYIHPLPFSCQKDSITIEGLPCDIHGENLRCLGVNTQDYHHYHIGGVLYCFPDEKMVITFEVEE